eukprot:4124437-Alexandrium_andersonii.AAC.1
MQPAKADVERNEKLRRVGVWQSLRVDVLLFRVAVESAGCNREVEEWQGLPRRLDSRDAQGTPSSRFA